MSLDGGCRLMFCGLLAPLGTFQHTFRCIVCPLTVFTGGIKFWCESFHVLSGVLFLFLFFSDCFTAILEYMVQFFTIKLDFLEK